MNNYIQQAKAFCDINDFTFKLKYERCFFAFVCTFRKIDRPDNSMNGLERCETYAMARGSTPDEAIMKALIMAGNKLNGREEFAA